MSKGGSRQRIRTSAKQFELILDFMEVHPNLATSQVHSSYTAKDRKREWAEFAHFLNSHRLGIHKDSDKWRKTWFDWKCNVRAKMRSAAGKKTLSPLEERLIAVTGLLDCEENNPSIPCKEGLPNGDLAFEVEDASPAFIASVASRARSVSSAHPVSETLQSAYGESQDEYIVPTTDDATSGETRLPVPVSIVASNGGPELVLTDIRSLASPVEAKQELFIVDDEEGSSEVDSAASGARESPADHALRDWVGAGEHPGCSPKRKVSSADGAQSTSLLREAPTEELKGKYEVQLFVANKRKLEAEERRADAEADFYREEKKRSVALANLHREEQRKVAAVAEFHAEERRKCAAKAEALLEHKKLYVEQQRTEVLRRRLLQLEIRKLRRDLQKNGGTR
ncbi:uncharacterized protein LOC144098463 isoform X2 [Amblyomma americanum]